MKQHQDWMWAGALDVLARAERLHRQFFNPAIAEMDQANWQPPVDVIETEDQVMIIAALPGVSAGQVKAVVDGGSLIITGERCAPEALKTAVIHRMELPQGRFARRIPLPPGKFGQVSVKMIDGCLVVGLHKGK